MLARGKSEHTVEMSVQADELLMGEAELKKHASRMAGLSIPDNIVPHISVHVPGGGDYSNCSLEGEEVNATLTWWWST